jgi:ribonuclease HII
MNICMQTPPTQSTTLTTTIVGIDEAGYGPLLGPLVIGATAFDVPVSVMKKLEDPADGPDLWELLRGSIKRKPNRRDPRLAVADSKKLYGSRGKDLALLERAALAFLAQVGGVPTSLRDLLGRVCPLVLDQLSEYPWYADRDPHLPLACSPDDLATQSNALDADMTASGVRFRGAWIQILPAGHYNRIVSATHNKAVVLFNQAMGLVQRISDVVGPRPLRVWVDRQGGRIDYRRPLMRAFDDAQLDILEQSDERSGYRLTREPAPWVIRFVKEGESHHLPIALASIISKYVRELFMTCFNEYWNVHVSDLRPTAGYYQDGQRFLADIADAVREQAIDRDRFVRVL